jgi:hypothetical protein
MKRVVLVLGGFLGVLAAALSAHGQNTGPIIDPQASEAIEAIDAIDPSGAKRFLADPGELVTLYGSRRFDPYYEPGRQPPPTDPASGWPIDWSFGAYTLVGAYSPYAYRYSPYGYGYYHSYYRPRYVPYGYGYGWGYRYPFGYYPWRAYGYYRPWHLDVGYGGQPPYVDYGASFHNEGVIVSPHGEFGGCFFW